MTSVPWDERIARAERLAAGGEPTAELLSFYATLLRAQKGVYEALRRRGEWLPSGALEEDLGVVRPMMPALLRGVEACGPPRLVEGARALLRADDRAVDELLLEYWRAPDGAQFFAKAFLQPYAVWLAETGARPVRRDVEMREGRCPFCGGRPQVSVLRAADGGSEGSGRALTCSTCLTPWAFPRVVCANCGEERPAKVGYYQAPEFEHVRVEACDTCGHYIKGVDLARLGLAVPLVDEVAAASLDIWACERGYTKIELNLVGL